MTTGPLSRLRGEAGARRWWRGEESGPRPLLVERGGVGAPPLVERGGVGAPLGERGGVGAPLAERGGVGAPPAAVTSCNNI